MLFSKAKIKISNDMILNTAFEIVRDNGIEKLVKISTNLKEEDIKGFHTKMWFYCHGIATLVASETLKVTEEQIRDLLSYEFQALMLLEENPNNKWVLKKKGENK